MAGDILHSLRIKYGLDHQPTPEQVGSWVALTEHYILSGETSEQAGIRAAKVVFPSFGTNVLRSQADTIEALLYAAKGK